MAATRSPNYPQVDLAAALAAIKPAYKAENRNKMSREVLARHLGYTGLNGRALAKIGAVRAYGLIEGTQDDLRISADAITCLEAPEGSAEWGAALVRCALKPSIFQDIRAEYPTLPSEHNLRFFLIKQNYTPEAASKAAQNYLTSMRLVEASVGAYDLSTEEESEPVETHDAHTERQQGGTRPSGNPQTGRQMAPPAGMRQSVFPLDEGDVTLIFPANLSSEGYAELKEYLDIFLRRAERTKRLEEAQEDFRDPPN